MSPPDPDHADTNGIHPEETADGPLARKSLGDRVRAGAAGRAARSPSTAPPSTRARIEGLEPRERLLSFAAAGLSVVMGLTIYLVQTNNHHFRVGKGQLTPQTTLVLGIVFGSLLLVATLIGRRAPIGFVALFAFLGFGLLFGLVFLLLAVWLLYRSYKFQKEATARAKETRASSPAGRTPVDNKRSAPTRGAPRATRSKAPSAPEPSKRYTPKRPPPSAPKPSRRDRKAAKTAE
jgi:hypothetical protein